MEQLYQKSIRRNLILLHGAVASFYCAALMATAIGPGTFVFLNKAKILSGLPPAVFMISTGLAAHPAGRAMDRYGRVPILTTGFCVGIAGMVLVALSVYCESAMGVLGGFVLVGISSGVVMLARIAGADMFPTNQRARGVALILFGCVPGAISGMFIFTRLFAHGGSDPSTFIKAWLLGAFFMTISFGLVALIKTEPKKIAETLCQISNDRVDDSQEIESTSLAEILHTPGVIPTLCAAIGSHSIMASFMSLIGFIMTQQGHHQRSVFSVIGLHLIGMFGLILLVGEIIGRFGKLKAMIGGASLVALCVASLSWIRSSASLMANMFLLGLGWSFAYVAATAALSALVRINERGKIIGFNDLVANMCGAFLSLLDGIAFAKGGVAGVTTLRLVAVFLFAICALLFWKGMASGFSATEEISRRASI